MVYSEGELKELSRIITKAGIYCISDEIQEAALKDDLVIQRKLYLAIGRHF